MTDIRPPEGERPRRRWGIPVLIGAGLLGIVAIAAMYACQTKRPLDDASRATEALAPRVVLEPPVLDLVRIDPDGRGVATGRGLPGASVAAALDGVSLGSAMVDGQGEWMLSGAWPLAQGLHRLEARLRTTAGHSLPGASVALVLSFREKDVRPLIVDVSATRPARVLQRPEGPLPGGLSVETVELASGALQAVTGRAEPGAKIRVTFDHALLGLAMADGLGHWTVAAAQSAAQGPHRLAVEPLDDTGQTRSSMRREVTLATVVPAKLPPGAFTLDEEPGLWRVTRGEDAGSRQILVLKEVAR